MSGFIQSRQRATQIAVEKGVETLNGSGQNGWTHRLAVVQGKRAIATLQQL
jgi:hypothetical protein